MNQVVWGDPPSSIVAKEEDSCVSFVFENTLTPSIDYQPLIHDSGVAAVSFGNYNEPDVFLVVPNDGWQLITENGVFVHEAATAIITICQLILG